MKRMLLSIALSVFAFSAAATTLNSVQLLNPAGSTSGQAILSTGPSTAPAWGPVALSGITGTLAIANGGTGATTQTAALTALLGSSTVPIANGGTGAATAATARTNLGLGTAATQNTGTSGATVPLLSTNNTWTSGQTIGYGGNVTLGLNDTSGTGQARVNLSSANVLAWGIVNASTSNQFTINRYVSGSLVDSAFVISNSTGAVTMQDGITNSPISGSTGSFTTLAASSTVSGVGFTTLLSPYALLASPTFTGTPAAPTAAPGTNTTQLATTAFVTSSPTINTPVINGVTNGSTAPSGAIGQPITNTGTSVALGGNGVATNITSISLTAGDWMVFGEIAFTATSSAVPSVWTAGASTTSATLPATPLYAQIEATMPANGFATLTIPIQLINVSSGTTVYLIGQANYSSGTTGTATGTVTAVRYH
jgi:hypothetical protein